MNQALGLITGALGTIGNMASTLINNHHNEQLVYEQNKWNLEQWNRENLYNTPVEQMKRLKAAGLNPNLIYGNGAGSLLSAPSPTMQSARTTAPQVDPMTLATIANVNADTAQKSAAAKNLGAQTSSLEIQNWLADFKNNIIDSNSDAIRQYASAEVNRLHMSSLNEYYQSAFSAAILASLFGMTEDGSYVVDGKRVNTYSIGNLHFDEQLARKFNDLGLNYAEQKRLEYVLYQSYVAAQEKINNAAGEEADMDAVIPSLINDCPRWLQPIVIGAWQLFKTARVPSFSIGHQDKEVHNYFSSGN